MPHTPTNPTEFKNATAMLTQPLRGKGREKRKKKKQQAAAIGTGASKLLIPTRKRSR